MSGKSICFYKKKTFFSTILAIKRNHLLLTRHQIFEFSIKFLSVVAFLVFATVIQLQNDLCHNPSSIRYNFATGTFQTNTFAFVICPSSFLAISIAIEHVLASRTFQHFTTKATKNENSIEINWFSKMKIVLKKYLQQLTMPPNSNHSGRFDTSISAHTQMASLAKCIYLYYKIDIYFSSLIDSDGRLGSNVFVCDEHN